MAKFEIKDVKADSVYVLVTLDDGSTFGQEVHQIDRSSEQAAMDSIGRCVQELITRLAPPIDLAVLDKHKGIEIPLTLVAKLP